MEAKLQRQAIKLIRYHRHIKELPSCSRPPPEGGRVRSFTLILQTRITTVDMPSLCVVSSRRRYGVILVFIFYILAGIGCRRREEQSQAGRAQYKQRSFSVMSINDTLRYPVLAMRYRDDQTKRVYPFNIFCAYFFFRPFEEIGIPTDTA